MQGKTIELERWITSRQRCHKFSTADSRGKPVTSPFLLRAIALLVSCIFMPQPSRE